MEIAVLAESRALMESINTQISKYRLASPGPGPFSTLIDKVQLVQRLIVYVENILGKFLSAMPFNLDVYVGETLSAVHNILVDCNSTMIQLLSGVFAGEMSSEMVKLKSLFRRILRANKLAAELQALESQFSKAENRLLTLISLMNNSLKVEDFLGHVEAADDVYHPIVNSPAVSGTVVLDFNGLDESGSPITPEGLLKQALLSPKSTAITAAQGVIAPLHGIVGMAGVGKTIALQGLAYDKDIRHRFPDGVLYMSIGQSATVGTILEELGKIVDSTGGKTISAQLRSATSVHDAVDYAIAWFRGRTCLFLIDDVWPTEHCETGFLSDLRQLLRQSPESRMAITTRSDVIAVDTGSVIRFEVRDPLGTVSEKIFMAHATADLTRKPAADSGGQHKERVSKILSLCGGLPLHLSKRGRVVALLCGLHGNFETACDEYLNSSLVQFDSNAQSLLGLEYLEAEFLKLKAKSPPYSIRDLYISLCVMEKKTWVSVSVLSRLWQLDKYAARQVVNTFSKLNVATVSLRRPVRGSSEEAGIELNDSQLDYCTEEAERMNLSSVWHARLLSRYLETSHGALSGEQNAEDGQTILGFEPRPWWSNVVPEDGYIHLNVARHLLRSDQGVELAALLLDARWTKLRAEVGGILELRTDFGLLETHFAQLENSREDKTTTCEVRRGFDRIFKALLLSWGRISEDLRAFQFQVCGRLLSLRKSNAIVDAYLTSVEKNTPKPYLLPVSHFFLNSSSGQIVEIPVEGECKSISCSPCGRYVAAGAGQGIVVVETCTGEKLQHLHGHSDVVCGVAFTPESRKIVSGSSDGKVMLWEWQRSNSPVQVLEGHGRDVLGVAVSGNGARIFSSSDDGSLRIWDAKTGAEIRKLPQNSLVNCVGISADGWNIAIGLYDGTLKVLDSITSRILFEDSGGKDGSVECVSFSPNGRRLAAGSFSTTIRVWDTHTWKTIGARLEGHEDWLTDLAFSPDGTRIVSCSLDGTVRLWDVESGKCVGVSPNISCTVQSVSFTAEGKKIVSGSNDGIVRIWNASLGREPKHQRYDRSEYVWGVAISQDGHCVASASTEGTVRFWNSLEGEQVGEALQGHMGKVTCVSFSPDGREVVTGSENSTMRLWDAKNNAQIGDPFIGHTDYVSCVSFSSDGLRIVSGAGDKTVRVWNYQTHEQIGDPLQGHRAAVRCVSESADGCHFVSRDSQLTIIWNRNTRAIIWKSGKLESDSKNTITDVEAEKILRNCGQDTPHLWPSSFLSYTGELFWEKGCVYSNLLGKKTLLGHLFPFGDWKYQASGNVLAAGQKSDAVAISRLIVE